MDCSFEDCSKGARSRKQGSLCQGHEAQQRKGRKLSSLSFQRRDPIIQGPIVYIPLFNGDNAIIDVEYLPLITGRNWNLSKAGYVQSRKSGITSKLHQIIMPGTVKIDHINRDKLYNRRVNLRSVSHSQSVGNTGPHKGRPYKGITRNYRGKWIAKLQGKYLGSFEKKEEAAMAYDKAAFILWGKYAYLNFPNEIYDE